ncbi:FHA domain-containing protein [Noviherbaspirillum sp. CPCC 100848]|uniref:FHA domain-containing protein n=1 Tax=Noviherbaspirillum album TaxID=3080276 RepID=A0ABU6J9J9_9BURK|nr:FHA domain-containing protein [Noviherbaspirillum sp. CPCC 100848]MEC4720319.1 FHA domain-containing protein [Noviherbaspirillum sp. CPCC 100848]
MAKIIVSSGTTVLQELALGSERVTIGRAPQNDLVLEDLAISAMHAMIVPGADGPYIEDLNSTNGTQINGQPFKKHFLQHDDVVMLAHYRLQFIAGEEASSPRKGAKAAGARLRMLSGPTAGREVTVRETLTTIGRPGIGVAGLIREADAYRIVHVEGRIRPLINGASMDGESCALDDGDMLDIAGVKMMFSCG